MAGYHPPFLSFFCVVPLKLPLSSGISQPCLTRFGYFTRAIVGGRFPIGFPTSCCGHHFLASPNKVRRRLNMICWTPERCTPGPTRGLVRRYRYDRFLVVPKRREALSSPLGAMCGSAKTSRDKHHNGEFTGEHGRLVREASWTIHSWCMLI
jgi:hypothetical protein